MRATSRTFSTWVLAAEARSLRCTQLSSPAMSGHWVRDARGAASRIGCGNHRIGGGPGEGEPYAYL